MAARGLEALAVKDDRWQSRHNRTCFICGAPVSRVAYTGMVYAHLGILVHLNGTCNEVVNQELRVFDRSPRGRWRPAKEVLARLREHKAAQGVCPDA